MIARKLVMGLLALGVVGGFGSGFAHMAAARHHWQQEHGGEFRGPHGPWAERRGPEAPAQIVVGAGGVLQVCRPLQPQGLGGQ